jgi:glucokinase
VQLYVGADIGATKTLVAAWSVEGVVQQRSQFPTPQELGEGLQRLFAAIEAVAAGARIAAVGVSIGGPIDRVAGTVSPLHQPQWRELPLRALLEERFGCPCAIEVDTDAAALGEWHFGQQRRSPLLYVTLSTGVGAGMVIEGELYRGVAGAHPELGHQVVPNEFGDTEPVRCACGAENCLEALISGRALERRFGCPPALLPQGVWRRVGRILAHGLRNAATLLAPAQIVLGGGIAVHAGQYFLPVVRQVLQEQLRLVPVPEVRLSALGYETALWGAFAIALRAAPPRGSSA